MPERDDTLDGPLLPMEMEGESTEKRRPWYKSKIVLSVLGAAIFFLLVILVVLWAAKSRKTGDEPGSEEGDLDRPPRYHNLFETQKKLPQHDLSLPFPEGATGRYVKFTAQSGQRLLGWNNVFTELLLHNYLAYKSRRGYVFGDYFWAPEHYPWPEDKALEKPARTPISALISGPTAGGPWPPGDPAPRSIHEDHWPLVCPPEKVKKIWTTKVKEKYKMRDNGTGKYIFNVWKKILIDDPAQCIEVTQPTIEEDPWPEVFDLFLLGGPRILDFLDEFRESLVSQGLKASPVVERSIQRNTHLFQTPETVHHNPFSRVLAVHIRRGDYVGHCKNLAAWHAGFYGWNQLPWLPDRYAPPTPEPGNYTEEYLSHCLPEMDHIIKRIEDARDDWEKETFAGQKLESHYIHTIYILTNALPEWHDEFAKKLKHDHKWNVVTSHDIVFGDAQEKDVGMAIDMELARRAGIFLGNGWSSFTSNIVHQRLIDKKTALSNRFF